MSEVSVIMVLSPGKPMLGQLVDSDYLLDFDIFHVSSVTELLHYVDGQQLGHVDTDTWIQTQYHVDSFTVSATQSARRLAAFMRLLHEDTGLGEDMMEVSIELGS